MSTFDEVHAMEGNLDLWTEGFGEFSCIRAECIVTNLTRS